LNAAQRTRKREQLAANIDGAILLLGSDPAPRNAPTNTHPFRQDSHFLYFTGLAAPALAWLRAPDGGDTLYATARDVKDIVWNGPSPSPADYAAQAGIAQVAPLSQLADDVAKLRARGVPIHYLPPYRADARYTLSRLLAVPVDRVNDGASAPLSAAVAAMRSVKSADEVAEIERALGVTAQLYDAALSEMAPGKSERDVLAAVTQVAVRAGMPFSFAPIITVRGEFLHNPGCAAQMRPDDLLLIDIGVEAAPSHYCSDITRTFPVGGRFSAQARAVYEIVLAAQAAAIAQAGPGVPNTEVHLAAVRVIVAGLKSLGLLRGNEEEAARRGAHTLFFPHGIGHMLGLDVHDLSDLGDLSHLTPRRTQSDSVRTQSDSVGTQSDLVRTQSDSSRLDIGSALRSTQSDYGLHLLRLTRPLAAGNVVTVEPGIYFIPDLVAQWQASQRLAEFIDYAAVAPFLGLGGIRIEDDILIESGGARVLGPVPILKSPDDIEARLRG
jgi:Xaa-Pro aminopeptidase